MKLSKSKLALAKVINENGGWRGGIFAAQDRSRAVTFFMDKPWRCGNAWEDDAFECVDGFISTEAINNWHQTCLSREEYYQAYPKADANGWIEWNGGECPVDGELTVYVNYRDGGKAPKAVKAGSQRWNHSGLGGDIMSYSLHNKDIKPELCESVTRSIPEPNAFELAYDPALVKLSNGRIGSESIDDLCAKVTEENKHQHIDAKQTIEQLAQDYRNANDYAVRLQKDAGDAAVKAESFAVEIRKRILELQELIG